MFVSKCVPVDISMSSKHCQWVVFTSRSGSNWKHDILMSQLQRVPSIWNHKYPTVGSCNKQAWIKRGSKKKLDIANRPHLFQNLAFPKLGLSYLNNPLTSVKVSSGCYELIYSTQELARSKGLICILCVQVCDKLNLQKGYMLGCYHSLT